MKKLNWKLIIFLLVGSVTSLVSIHFLHGFQVSRNADGLLERAEAALVEGNYKEAVRNRQRYLKHRPEDKSQLAQLAIDMKAQLLNAVELDVNLVRNTLEVMEVAVRENPRHLELRNETAAYHMLLGRHKDAADHLNVVRQLQAESEPDPDVEMRLARCHIALGQREDAARILQVLIGYDAEFETFDINKATSPTNVNAYRMLSSFYKEFLQDDAAAERVMNQMVVANAESAEAYLQRSRFWRSIHTDDEKEKGLRLANQDIQKALELNPEDTMAVIGAAQIAMEKKDFDRAQQLLDDGRAKNPDNHLFYSALADLATQQNDAERATQYVDQGLQRLPESRNLIWKRANIELFNGNVEAAKRSIDRLEKLNYSKELTQYFRARILVIQNRYSEASNRLEKLRPLLVRRPAIATEVNRLLSECYRNLGQTDLQLGADNRILNEDPDNLMARLSEAQALEQRGNIDAALKRYQEILAESTDDKRFSVTRVYQRMLKILQKRELRKPEEQRNWQPSRDMAKKAFNSTDMAPEEKAVFLARIYITEGKKDIARKKLDEALSNFPANEPLWLLRYDSAADTTDAKKTLDQMQQQLGDTLAVRLARVDHVSTIASPEKAVSELQQLEQGAEKFEQADQLWRGIAAQYLRFSKRQETVRLWKQIAALRPDDIRIRLSLFDISREMNDEDAMNEALDEIERKEGRGNSHWKVCNISRTIWKIKNGKADVNEIAKAKAELEEIRTQRPNWPTLLSLQGDIQLLEKDIPGAISTLEKIVDLTPGNVSARRRLVQLYNLVGKTEDAENILADMSHALVTTRDERAKLLMLEKNEKWDEAIGLAGKTLDDSVAVDQLWLSRILVGKGDLDQAEKTIRKAIVIDTSSRDAWLSLVRLLVSQNKNAAAEQVILESQSQLPEGDMAVTVGQMYEELGELDRAIQHFRLALEAVPDDPLVLRLLANLFMQSNHPDKARPYLERIVGTILGPSTNSNVVWARRTMAQLLTRSGSYKDYEKAIAILKTNRTVEGQLSSQDASLWAVMAVRRPDAKSRREAIAMLEKRQSNGQLDDNLSFVLAQLYEKDDRWDETRDLMVDLISKHPDNQLALERWLSWLLKRKQTKDADIWSKNLPNDSPAKIRYDAKVWVQEGNKDRALARIREMVPRPLRADQHGKLVQVALFLEELAEYDSTLYAEAEKYMREYVKTVPDKAIMLAAMLGRQPDTTRIQEAFNICEQAVSPKTLMPIVQIGVDTLKRHQQELEVTSPEFRRVGAWLSKAMGPDPAKAASMLVLLRCSYEELRGNLDGVAKLYESYLKRDDITPRQQAVVQNNLAYVYALTNRGEQALKMIDDAEVEIGPTSDVLDTRGMIYLELGQSNKAVLAMQSAIADGGPTAIKMFHLALAQSRSGNKSAAVEALEKARELGFREDRLTRVELEHYRDLMDDVGDKNDKLTANTR